MSEQEAVVHDKANPRVVIAVSGGVLCHQSYDNYEIVNPKEPIPAPEFFNRITKRSGVSVFGFMNSSHNFIGENCLSKIIDVLYSDPHIGGVYTDQQMVEQGSGDFLLNKYMPSYDAGISQSQLMMNIPVFVKSDVRQLFNEELQYLYYWDMIKKLSAATVLWHIPEPLLTSELISVDISEDLQKINGQVQA